MVYIIVAHTFDSGEIVIDDTAYSTYSLAEKALKKFKQNFKLFDSNVEEYEIKQLFMMVEE